MLQSKSRVLMPMVSIRLSSLRSPAIACAEVRPPMVSPAYVLTDGAVVVPPEMVFLSVTSSRLSPPVRISSAPER